MLRLAGVSFSERPLVTSGMAFVDAAVPVVVGDARAVAPEPGLDGEGRSAEAGVAAPKVTWSLVPSKSRAVFGRGDVGDGPGEGVGVGVGAVGDGDGDRCGRRRWCRRGCPR